MKNTSNEPIYVICHTDEDTIHYVQVDPGLTLDSGQDLIKSYTTKALLETDILAKFSSPARDRIHTAMALRDN